MSLPHFPAGSRSFRRIVVPEGKYFVMGDNEILILIFLINVPFWLVWATRKTFDIDGRLEQEKS